jgi:hypothetical protein
MYYFPSDMYEIYQTIPVSTPQGTTTIKVRRYRCSTPAFGGTAGPEMVKDGFLNITNYGILTEAGADKKHASPFTSVFVGKGSPAQFSTVLPLIVKYKDAFVNAYKNDHRKPGSDLGPGDCARMMAGFRPEQWPEMLQQFTDDYLGLDCNGFVGNYVQKTKMSLLGPDSPVRSYYTDSKGVRKTVAEVQAHDALVWQDFQHLAIIEEFDGDRDREMVIVYQSTDDLKLRRGPQFSTHKLVAQNGLFSLSPQSVVGGWFYVVNLNLLSGGPP